MKGRIQTIKDETKVCISSAKGQSTEFIKEPSVSGNSIFYVRGTYISSVAKNNVVEQEESDNKSGFCVML